MPWAPDYITRAELGHYVAGGTMDPAQLAEDGVELDIAVSAGSRAIDRFAGRQFGVVAAPEAREYTLRWSRSMQGWTALVDDFMTTVGMLVAFDSANDGTYLTNIPLTGVVMLPSTAARRSRPWERLLLRRSVATGLDGRPLGLRVTTTWGWTSVPLATRQANLLQSSRFFFRRNSPSGVAGSPAEGSELRLLAKLDPDVGNALLGYRRRMWAR